MHWIVIYINIKLQMDYFDSFGMVPAIKTIEQFLNRNAILCEFNSAPVQDLFSEACGHHCIFFAAHRCIVYDMII